jgi:peptidyl-tRNA hydrolase, PTH1 family
MPESRLIVGLGNPGKNYEYTRHNLGFLVVHQLATRLKCGFESSSLTKGLTAKGSLEQKEIHFLLPMNFINNSGPAVKQIMVKEEIALENICIVCDDLNLDFRQLRIRSKGSDGGHNGLGSIIYHLESDAFPRLRMGIGQPKGKADSVDYVLEEFKKDEKRYLEDFIIEAAECC